jgi:hypothetical protein
MKMRDVGFEVFTAVTMKNGMWRHVDLVNKIYYYQELHRATSQKTAFITMRDVPLGGISPAKLLIYI